MDAEPPTVLVAGLFEAHAAAVLRFARRRLSDEQAAWDVVSETFLTAWRHAGRCPAEPAERLPWLYAIAGNAVRTARRTELRRARLHERAAAHTRPGEGDDPALGVVADAALAGALAALSETDREVLRLVGWERLPDARSLGLALGVSPAAAAVRVHRARRRLQARLDAGSRDTGGDAEPRLPPALAPVPRRTASGGES